MVREETTLKQEHQQRQIKVQAGQEKTGKCSLAVKRISTGETGRQRKDPALTDSIANGKKNPRQGGGDVQGGGANLQESQRGSTFTGVKGESPTDLSWLKTELRAQSESVKRFRPGKCKVKGLE